MPQVIHDKPKRRGRKVGLVVCVVVVGVIAAVVVFVMLQAREQQAKKAYAVIEKQAVDLIARNNSQLAVESVQAYLAKNPPAPYRGKGEMLLGTAYLNTRKYQDALNAFKTAEHDGRQGDQMINHSIAESAWLAGDKVTAIVYYKKELAILKTRGDKYHQLDISSLEARIAVLEAGK